MPPARMIASWFQRNSGFRQRAEQVLPPLGGAHLPVVAHGGEAIVSFETTAADALELTVDPPLEQAQGLEPGHAGDESQTIRKNVCRCNAAGPPDRSGHRARG